MFEKMPPVKCSPRMRSCTMACEETSMKQYSHPASTMRAIISFSRMASGVVWVDSMRSVSMR